MMKMLKHAALLAGFIIVGMAVALAWFTFHSDELLRAEVLRQVGTILPDSIVDIDRAQFDFRNRVRLVNFSLRLPGEEEPSLIVPEVVIVIDRRAWQERQQFLVESLEFHQPQLRAMRTGTGSWDWSQVTFVRPQGDGPLPQFEIRHGSVQLALLNAEETSSYLWRMEDVHFLAQPDSQRSFAVRLAARSELTGQVSAEATVPLEPAAWQGHATLERVTIDPTTLELVQRFVPDLPQRIQQGHQWLREKVPAANAPEALARRSQAPLDLGLSLVTGLTLKARQRDPESPVEYLAHVDIHDGQITHEVLPRSVRNLQGSITTNGTELTLQGFKASDGRSQLTIDGRADRVGMVDLSCQAVKLPIDEPTVARLPAALQRIAHSLSLSGLVDGTARAQRTPGHPWKFTADASLSDGRVTHERFRYPVHDVQGTLSWHDDVIQLHGTGRANQVTVSMVGSVHNPGPAGEALYDIRADDVPVDEALIAAAPQPIQQTLVALQARGKGSAWLRVMRPAGLDQKHTLQLRTKITDGSIKFKEFPYEITQLTGKVDWIDDVLTMQNLRGRHNDSHLTGTGTFDKRSGPGHLTLDVHATQGSLDRALYAALNRHLQEVWDAFNPSGRIDLDTHIEWTPGQPARVEVPQLILAEGAVQMRDFPYPFQDVAGEFAYDFTRNEVAIRKLTARHDDTHLSTSGFATCGSPWTVKLESLHVDDLSPTPAFRRTLAPELKQIVDTMNPVGRFSFEGPVTFYGPARIDEPLRADWDLDIVLAGCSLNAGLRLDDIHGKVDLTGKWDGVNATLQGRVALDSLAVFRDHRITQIQGPFKLIDQELTVGSAQMAKPIKPDAAFAIAPTARMIGTAYQGDAKLDAIVDFRQETTYLAHLELNGASLERYALQHLRGHSNVRGLMNGWMDLHGRGYSAAAISGDGQLQISPAALYELPVFLQIFQLPQFQPATRSAFNYANFLFHLRNERFDFQAIDLVGPSLSLRGRGYVRFDGMVMLDFFTMQPRNAVPIIGLREIVGLVNQMSQGWLAVEVRGSMAKPEARVVPFPELDAALKQFLGAFEPRPNGPPPTFRPTPRSTESDRGARR